MSVLDLIRRKPAAAPSSPSTACDALRDWKFTERQLVAEHSKWAQSASEARADISTFQAQLSKVAGLHEAIVRALAASRYEGSPPPDLTRPLAELAEAEAELTRLDDIARVARMVLPTF